MTYRWRRADVDARIVVVLGGRRDGLHGEQPARRTTEQPARRTASRAGTRLGRGSGSTGATRRGFAGRLDTVSISTFWRRETTAYLGSTGSGVRRDTAGRTDTATGRKLYARSAASSCVVRGKHTTTPSKTSRVLGRLGGGASSEELGPSSESGTEDSGVPGTMTLPADAAGTGRLPEASGAAGAAGRRRGCKASWLLGGGT